MWWDETAIDPDGGQPATYEFTQDGKRFRPGELDDVIRVFDKNGSVTGYAPS